MAMSGAITIENIHNHHNRSSPNKTPIQQEDEIRFGSASPKARRLAKEAGIDLSSISGSGPDGLVIASDIERESLTRPENEECVELPSIRRTIAARMAQSKQTIPHFYLFAQVDMLECQRLRILCKDELNWERKPSYTDLIVKACSSALTAMPEVNVGFEDNTFVRHDGIHIGIAVGLAEGLIVKVIRDVNLLSLRELVVRSQVAIEEARTGQLKEPDIGKKCMVVSNLGMEGVDAFAAIIDPPDAMILTVGKVTDQVVPIDERPCVRPMCTLVLSVDHRVLDGVGGSRFLMQIKSIIENPFSLL
jgi:pyruvate dehydrogenase E2 component (dihydrolipoamide acetyltransferase)